MPKSPPTPVETDETYDQIIQLWTSDDFDRSNGMAVPKHAIAFTQRRRRALDVGCGCGGTDEPEELYDSAMGPEVYYGSLGVNYILTLLDNLGCHIRHVEFDQYPELHVCIIAQKSSALSTRSLD